MTKPAITLEQMVEWLDMMHVMSCEIDDMPNPVNFAIRDLLQSMQWRPIDSAPRDGTHILLKFGVDGPVVGGCWDYIGCGDWESGQVDVRYWMTDDDLIIIEDPSTEPTHWMPLPSLPQEDTP